MDFPYMRFGDAFLKYQPFSQSEELFRHIRPLSSSDMEKIQNDASNYSGDRLPVITSPHGMRGRVSAFCPSDFVKQVYLKVELISFIIYISLFLVSSGKFRTSNGIVGLQRDVCQVSSSHLKGQSCYVEVTLGFPATGDKDTHYSNLKKSLLKHQDTESSSVASGVQKGLHDQFSVSERYYINMVKLQILDAKLDRVIIIRFTISYALSLTLHLLLFHFIYILTVLERDSADGSRTKANVIHSEQDYHSSSNSISCSISSISGTSSDSDCQMAAGVGELDADADSLTSRQVYLRMSFQIIAPNRSSSDSCSLFLRNYGESAYKMSCFIYRVPSVQEQPPGTAEFQALMFSIPDSGDLGSSPNTGIMDVADQMLLPVGFPS
ncbi:hypothetical protein RHSIM_Rhsim12G0118500 [Rhododendron simsii]|uniref:Mediator of RNA polymerase II transcription subunit 13 n=1 Tax=Rhododendron simsii TaxID=118357 RepID=A0A834G9L9_RHOSS|nr:hypothetical protein RHSIM_Rhsim12G0118500 [Rhododendron simsii]